VFRRKRQRRYLNGLCNRFEYEFIDIVDDLGNMAHRVENENRRDGTGSDPDMLFCLGYLCVQLSAHLWSFRHFLERGNLSLVARPGANWTAKDLADNFFRPIPVKTRETAPTNAHLKQVREIIENAKREAESNETK